MGREGRGDVNEEAGGLLTRKNGGWSIWEGIGRYVGEFATHWYDWGLPSKPFR